MSLSPIRLASLLGALVAAAGCAGEVTGGGAEGTRDSTPPILEIRSPERGTVTDGGSVVVEGRATDPDGTIAQVTLNGEPVALNGDGSFSHTLMLADGITLIETIAQNASGHQTTDARAVLGGALVPQDTEVADAIVGHLSPEAIDGLGAAMAIYAEGTDFTAIATALNPVVKGTGDCNSADVYVNSIEHDGIDVALVPVQGGMTAQVTIRNLVVKGKVNFRAVCVSGSANWSISATAYDVGGVIHPTLANKLLSVALDGVTSKFTGFSLNINNVPGFIEDMFDGKVRDKIEDMLRDQVTTMVPDLTNDYLSEFMSDAFDIPLLGKTIQMALWPSSMTWSPQGGTIVLDTKSTVEGVTDALYLATPKSRPSDADMMSPGFRLGVADDMLNQLLSAVWVSGALEEALLPVEGDMLSAGLGGDVAQATITMMLPPVANFDTATGAARLTVGDLVIDAVDASGTTLAKFVVSADIDLAAENAADGTITLKTKTARILAQVLEQSPTLVTELNALRVTGIAELAIGEFVKKADGLLANLPIPGVPGASIATPSFQPSSGYLLMGGQLAF